MCLDRPIEGKLPKQGIGYKVYEKVGWRTYTPCCWRGLHQRTGGTYIDKNNIRIPYDDIFSSYETGFHVFEDIKDARCWCGDFEDRILKVKYSQVVARGIQSHRKVIVAKKITLLKVVK